MVIVLWFKKSQTLPWKATTVLMQKENFFFSCLHKPEQPGLAEGVLACGRYLGLYHLYKVLSNPHYSEIP